MWIKAHTWKNNKSKFLQTVSDSKSAWAASTFSSDSFIFLHEENRKNRPLPWFLLPSHWAKVKLIFISTSNSFWVLRCHTRVTGAGENGTFLRYWQANNIFKIKLLGVGSSTCQNIAWSEVLVTQSCLTLCDPMDCSLPDSSDHGILQARLLEWVTMPSSRGSSQPRDWTCVSDIPCTSRQIPYHCATWETQASQYTSITLLHLDPNHPDF